MAKSATTLVNIGFQKLGAEVITSLTQDHRNAKKANICYEPLRDKELRINAWNFSKKRVVLAKDATAPLFDFESAFVLPSDYIRWIKPTTYRLDWTLENHNGKRAILTNDGDSINLEYLARITDVTLFDDAFFEALATKIAWHLCEAITQSNTKKAALLVEYDKIMAEARKYNAFEKLPDEQPEDSFLTERL